MNVYLARAIRGDHDENDGFILRATIDAVKNAGHKPQFEQPVPTKLRDYNNIKLTDDQYIYRRDIYWLNNSQAMIAEVSNPSTGVGYEIAYARHAMTIPILCVARKNASVSAMITGCFDVVRYLTTDELKAAIGAFLALVENKDDN